ncbi:MAG: hypothetical protein ABSA63_08220 [Thermoplasmata archaeon]|jgi:hypothetical protein
MVPENPDPDMADQSRSTAVGSRPSSRYMMTERGYLHPMKTYIWITLLIIGIMSLLYYILGLGPSAQGSLPPAFAFGASDLYFHSIAIGIASLGVYLVFMAFDLDKYEPAIDFPIAYRALMATVIGAIGAFFYLRPIFNANLAPIPLGLILLGLILLADVGGALLVQLYLLPGKLAGTYDPSQNRLGMIPKWRYLPSWKDFRKMDSTYWLTFVTVISTFVAGVIGFVVFWMNYFVIDIGMSPAIFSGYIAWLGGAQQVLETTMGAHSHMMVMALILGVVAVTAKRFDVLALVGWKRGMAKVGLWVSITGILALTVVFVLEGFTTVFPGGVPGNVFGSNPGGSVQLLAATGATANGMAGDDTTMLWAALGAIIVLIPLLYTKVRGRPAWKDPVRAAILGTWIFSFIATPIQGFDIEFNEATLSGGPTDVVFGNLQYFALIGITLICMSLLAIDFYVEKRGMRTPMAGFAMLSTLIATVGAYIYVWYGTNQGSPGYWVFNVGFVMMDLFLILAMVAVYLGREEKISIAEAETDAPENKSAPKHPESEKVSA